MRGIRLVYGLKQGDREFLNIFYPTKRFCESAIKLGIDYKAMIHKPIDNIDDTIKFCAGNIAFLRGDLSTSLYQKLETNKIITIQNINALELAGDKLKAAEHFKNISAKHPCTYHIANDTMPNLTFPFIVKPRFGKMGRGVFLVNNKNEWHNFITTKKINEDYIAQEYIDSSYGTDIRFFFAHFNKGNDFVCVKRKSLELTSNAHSGGVITEYKAPAFLAEEASRIFANSGLVYGTVDFLIADKSNKKFLVCETNSMPGFEALEKSLNIDVATAILKSIITFTKRPTE